MLLFDYSNFLIHAPTRGATPWREPLADDVFHVSIHAPTRGATKTKSMPSCSVLFQFTRPHGARRMFRCKDNPRTGFNSRAHAGRDPPLGAQPLAVSVSIHAPTRGATHDKREGDGNVQFQFTRPRWARLLPMVHYGLWHVLIHAPTRGATPFLALRLLSTTSFNSRAHAGRDACMKDFQKLESFQP